MISPDFKQWTSQGNSEETNLCDPINPCQGWMGPRDLLGPNAQWEDPQLRHRTTEACPSWAFPSCLIVNCGLGTPGYILGLIPRPTDWFSRGLSQIVKCAEVALLNLEGCKLPINSVQKGVYISLYFRACLMLVTCANVGLFQKWLLPQAWKQSHH